MPQLLICAVAAVLFGLWFATWGRALPLRPRASFPIDADDRVIAVSNDGQWIVTRTVVESRPFPFSGTGISSTFLRGPIRVWDARNGSVVAEVLDRRDDCSDVTVSEDCRFLAIRGFNQQLVRLFDGRTGRELRFSPLPVILESGLSRGPYCFSPDGRWFANLACCQEADHYGPCVAVWDLTEEQETFVLPKQDCPLAFSPDSTRLATTEMTEGRNTEDVVLWELTRGREIQRYHGDNIVSDLRFSSQGQRLVAYGSKRSGQGPMTATVFDLQSGREVERCEKFAFFAFMPNGTSLAPPADEEDWFPAGDPRERLNGAVCLTPHHQYLQRFRSTTEAPSEWWQHLRIVLLGDPEDDTSCFTKFYAIDSGKLVLRLEGCPDCFLSSDERVAACSSGDGIVRIWDLPPRRSVFLPLALAIVPTLLITAGLWWRLRPTLPMRRRLLMIQLL